MYKIYNKKLQKERAYLRLNLQRSNTLISIIQTTANFAFALRSKPIF